MEFFYDKSSSVDIEASYVAERQRQRNRSSRLLLLNVHGFSSDSVWAPDPGLGLPAEIERLNLDISKIIYDHPTTGIDNVAQQLLRDILSAMEDESNSDSEDGDHTLSQLSPVLVFAAHDIGGTVLKRALVMASRDLKYKPILQNTSLMLFFATTHRASSALPWDGILSRMLHFCCNKIHGPWVFDFTRHFSTFHEKLAQDFDSVDTQFQIVNVFQNESKSANYEPVVEKFAATLDREDEIQVGVYRSHRMLGHLDTPELCKLTNDLLEDARTRKCKDYLDCMQLLSPGELRIGHRPISKPIYRNLCKWILSGPVLNDWMNSKTQHIQVLTIKPTADQTSFLSSVIASIRVTRRNQTDLFITASHYQLGKGVYKRAKLLAALVSQIICRCPRLFLEIAAYQDELRNAFDRANISWIELLLWKSLETLLCFPASNQIFCIIYQSQQPKPGDPCEKLMADLVALIKTKEVSSKILIVATALPDTLSGTSILQTRVNLGEAEAHAELRKDLEWQLDLVGQKHRGLVPFKSTVLDHIFEDSIDLQRIRYFLGYIEHLPFPTEAAIKETLHKFSDDSSAFCTILELVRPSSQSLVKEALSLILHSMRPLTCHELGVALSIPGDHDEDSSQMTGRRSLNVAEELESTLCGILEIDNDTIYLTHDRFGAFLDQPPREIWWCRIGHDSRHPDIARRCLTYLSHQFAAHPKSEETCSNRVGSANFADSPSAEEIRQCPWWCDYGSGETLFLDYAAENWHKHLQLGPLELDHQVRLFLDVDKQWNNRTRLLLGHKAAPGGSYQPDRICAPLNLCKALQIPLTQAIHIAIRATRRPGLEPETEWSSLFLAVVQADDMATMLRLHEMNPLIEESTLLEAFATGSDDALCELSRLQPEFVSAKSDMILSHAARLGNERLVDFLLNEKYHDCFEHVDASGLAPLYQAVKWGHSTISKRLYGFHKPSPHVQLIQFDQGQTILHVAARHGDSSLIAMICNGDMDVDINCPASAEVSPLYLASRNGHIDAVKQLVRSQADADIADKNGDTALHAASSRGFYEVASALIHYGANVNIVNRERKTALHVAIESGHDSIALCLLGLEENSLSGQIGQTLSGSKRNVPPEEYAPKIHKFEAGAGASQSVNEEAVRPSAVHTSTILGSTAVEPEESIMTKTRPSTTKRTAGKRVMMDVNIEPPLLPLAAKGNQLKIIKALLEKKAPCNAGNEENRTALHVASKYGYYDIFHRLAESGADIHLTDDFNTNALHSASLRGHTRIVQELLERGADAGVVNASGCTALQFACAGCYIGTFQALLPHCTNQDRKEAFHIASLLGQVDIMALLLESGTDKDAQDAQLNCALHFAVYSNSPQVSEMLLIRRARLEMKDEQGRTPLHEAAVTNSLSVLELLLSAGADTNTKDKDDRTALYLAAETDHLDAVRVLLKNGASLEIPSHTARHQYKSFLELSVIHFSVNVTKLILDHYKGMDGDISTLVSSETLQNLVQCSEETQSKIQMLLDTNLDPNNSIGDLGTMLHYAAYEGNLAVVRLLLESSDRMKVNVISGRYGTAIQAAAYGAKRHAPDIIRFLLEKNANPCEVSGVFGTALQAAASQATRPDEDSSTIALKIARIFLDHNVVNVVGGKYGTALQAAAACAGGIKLVKLLLKKGAETDAVCGLYGTALHAAAAKSTLRMVRIILKKTTVGKDQRDVQGRLPLHLAAARNRQDLVERLTEEEANVNVRSVDKFGRNALHFAAGSGSKEVMDEILDRHADLLNIPDNDGWYPIHWACRRDSQYLVSWLLQKGANGRATTKNHWTPWHVATYHDASLAAEQLRAHDDISADNVAREGTDANEMLPTAAANQTPFACDCCFCMIFGKVYTCKSCFDTRYCFKCYQGMSPEMHYPEHSWEETA